VPRKVNVFFSAYGTRHDITYIKLLVDHNTNHKFYDDLKTSSRRLRHHKEILTLDIYTFLMPYNIYYFF